MQVQLLETAELGKVKQSRIRDLGSVDLEPDEIVGAGEAGEARSETWQLDKTNQSLGKSERPEQALRVDCH